MGQETGISWTDHTFNPWWGCSRVSPGCEHCYAETFAKRVGHAKGGSKLPLWGVDEERKPASEKTWAELEKWDESARLAGVRRRVFVASMADIFEIAPERNARANEVMEAGRKRLWKAIEECVHLDFQLLTKRPQNVAKLALWKRAPWPENVWLGTTVEDQIRADERIPILLSIPAKVRFLSCEPLLELVDLRKWLGEEGHESNGPAGWVQTREQSIDWVIVGGESGPGARRFDPTWAFEILHECKVAGVAAWFKQLGENYFPKFHGSSIKAKKGDDPSEWPHWLRVQQFPKGVA